MISDDVSRLDEMRSQVTEFHNNNPEVWKMFVGFTFEMIMSGRKHYSVNAVFERLRWEVDIKHGRKRLTQPTCQSWGLMITPKRPLDEALL